MKNTKNEEISKKKNEKKLLKPILIFCKKRKNSLKLKKDWTRGNQLNNWKSLFILKKREIKLKSKKTPNEEEISLKNEKSLFKLNFFYSKKGN